MRIFLAHFTFTNDIKIKIVMKSTWVAATGKDTFFIPPEGGWLLRLSRAFSATLTGRFGMGTVRMGGELVGTERLILTQHSPYL
jgi:hypothetical protein